MTDPSRPNAPADLSASASAPLPTPTLQQRRRPGLSMVWLVPILALVLGLSLVINHFLQTGPRIDIEFRTAEGLEPGKTELRYKELAIGRLETVTLSDDRQTVRARVRLDRSASKVAVEDSSFWVVRPRIGAAGVSGLGTLVSGAYIAVDAGESTGSRRNFVGLEAPPFVLRGEPGRSFVLRASDLGSLDVGSPVLYRRTRVGRVVGYSLDPQADEVSVKVFIESPYENLVTPDTRFWNASGVSLSLNAGGLNVQTQTLATLLAGGVAFERPEGAPGGTGAPDGTQFVLHDDRKAAMAPVDGQSVRVAMVFDQSARGLSMGAPIDFLGVDIGQVRQVALQYDEQRQRFPVHVTADIYPLRLGAVRQALLASQPQGDVDRLLLQRLVEKGLRAQLRTGNLLTGQLYVALDFQPGGRAATLGRDADNLPLLPTVRGTLSEVQPQLAEIVQKIHRIPFDGIALDLQSLLRGTRKTIDQLGPEAQQTLSEVKRTLESVQSTMKQLDHNLLDPNAPVQRSFDDTLRELQRAAQSLRVLGDYLQQHPESLLRGKPADPALPPPGTEPTR